ncbi:LemA protein [Seinonella peptonophila]|uniref:LemA protein n=1 Tax=Seinonella peptonophila TaxID=112248 RepID=A0A1M4Y986_9BACL|nr:LemA family protein [Seinonella peptonophila]SHF02407.1 LemA protein [Seinonella peptonophila]
MIVIKERTYIKKFFVFAIGIIIGWIFYIFVAALFTSGDDIPDIYGILALVLSVLTMVVYSIISEFNYLKQLKFATSSLLSNISAFHKREQKLISKAEEVIATFLKHESNVHQSIATSRNDTKKVVTDLENISLSDLMLTVENYPRLKSDKHISKILEQIEESQNAILESKLMYNQYIAYYNGAIYSFPANIFSSMWNLKPLPLYEEQSNDDIS